MTGPRPVDALYPARFSSGVLIDPDTGTLTTPHVAVTGVPGATAASRFAGATTWGCPAAGDFLLGDVTVDQTGSFWVCTGAGNPGAWAQVGGTSWTWGAGDSGYTVWNYDPLACTRGTSAPIGTIMLLAITIPFAATVTSVSLWVTQTFLGATDSYAGLYSASGGTAALVGTSADQSAAWRAGTGLVTAALLGGPYAVAAGDYYAAYVQNSSAVYFAASPAPPSGSDALPSAGAPAEWLRFASNGTGTSLPATITLSSNVASTATNWCALS